MRRNTCSVCNHEYPAASVCCPYCAVIWAERELQADVERELHMACQWDCHCPECAPPLELARLRRTTALVLLLMAACSSLALTRSMDSSHRETRSSSIHTASSNRPVIPERSHMSSTVIGQWDDDDLKSWRTR